MRSKIIVWKGEGASCSEKILLERKRLTIVATSHVSGGDAELNTKWDAEYKIICDKSWCVRQISINEKLFNHRLTIYGDGNGHWADQDGKELKDIQGCIDIDFRATPFSNTLPIRRLQLAAGEKASIEVVYINAPDLRVTKEQQIYTRLSEHNWKFEQPSADFTAIITVDDEGLILNYPGLFTRIT